MGFLYRVDLSSLQTHSERINVLDSFSEWETYSHWINTDSQHRTIDYFEVFCDGVTPPSFPAVPQNVTIHQCK